MPFLKWRKFQVGTGAGRAGASGLLDASFVSAAGKSNAGAPEEILTTVKIPANSLYKNGVGLLVSLLGSFAATGNNKKIKIYLNSSAAIGGLTVADSGVLTDNGKKWWIDLEIWRTAAAVQIGSARILVDTAIKVLSAFSGTQNHAVDLWLVVTSTADAAADIVLNSVSVRPQTL